MFKFVFFGSLSNFRVSKHTAKREMLTVVDCRVEENAEALGRKRPSDATCFLPKDCKEMSQQPCSHYFFLES